jgi:hypothetical protein
MLQPCCGHNIWHMLFPTISILYFDIRTFSTAFHVYFVRYCFNDFEMQPIGTNITGITFVYTLQICCIFILWFVVVVSE